MHQLAAAAVDARGAQAAAPDAAGVEREQVGAIDQAQRAPVAEGDRGAEGAPPGRLEPGQQAGRGGVGAFLDLEVERAVGGDEAHACERVDDEAPALDAVQGLAPARRLVAVHQAQERCEVGAAQHGLDLVRQGQRLRDVPLWRHAGMHQQPALGLVGQRPLAQPVEPGLAVGCGQDLVQGVAAVRAAHAVGEGQQVQVVVAEQAGRAALERAQPAQHGQRARAAVDQVAQRMQVVARGRVADLGEQPRERVVAALDVADQPVHGRHCGVCYAARLPTDARPPSPGSRWIRPCWSS